MTHRYLAELTAIDRLRYSRAGTALLSMVNADEKPVADHVFD